MRFTLLPLFIAVTMIAIATAGMTYRTEFWTSAILTLTLGLLGFMAIRAIAMVGEPRAFALAFSVVGLIYLLLASSTTFRIHSFLLTNYALAWLALKINVVAEVDGIQGGGVFSIPDDLIVSPHIGSQVIRQFGGGGTTVVECSSLQQVIEIAATSAPVGYELQMLFLMGHCLWTWIIGLAAGYTAAYLYCRSHRAELVGGSKAVPA